MKLYKKKKGHDTTDEGTIHWYDFNNYYKLNGLADILSDAAEGYGGWIQLKSYGLVGSSG